MKRIITYLVVASVIGFFGTALHNINIKEQKLDLKSIELQDTGAKLKTLETKYIDLNEQLDKELHQKQQDAQKIQQLEEERLKLEQEKVDLQKQLQAKAAERAKLAAASNRVSAASAPEDIKTLMTLAGISESDYYYVNCVIAGCEGVSAEGGWNGVQRWNTAGSGAYGICQSLPASKMASAGSDYMTNIVTQLKWCHGYAQGYGSWAKAWEFRKCLGSCYSTRTKNTVYKDHTWW